MISPQSRKVRKSFALLAVGSATLLALTQHLSAAEVQVKEAPAPATTPEEARAFLKINLARKACQQPLVLTVTNASLDDIGAHVEKQLSAPKADPKLKVQVRDARPVRFSFVSKGSTVAEVLGSAAMLAQAQLWVFSDYLLIAPQKALSPDELDAIKKGLGTQAKDTTWDVRPENRMEQQRAFSTFIGNEIKGMKPAVKMAQLSPRLKLLLAVGPVLGAATTSQLSPESRAMLQELLNPMNEGGLTPKGSESLRNVWPLRLTDNTQVRLSPAKGGELDVAWIGPNEAFWNVKWSLNGISSNNTMSGPVRSPQTPPSPPAATPFDPSAGKS